MVIAYVGFLLIITGALIMYCYPYNKEKNARCTEQTQGELIEIIKRFNSEGPRKDMHVYSYQVDGVEYHLRTADHNLQVRNVGDRCTIWYNPSKPKDAQAFRGSDEYLKKLLKGGIVVLLLGALLFFFAFIQQLVLLLGSTS